MTLFKLGPVVMTSGIRDVIRDNPSMRMFFEECLTRHSKGDWGDLCSEDKEMNDAAIESEREGNGYTDSLMSVYRKDGLEYWIITEWDRTTTTILLPCEY